MALLTLILTANRETSAADPNVTEGVRRLSEGIAMFFTAENRERLLTVSAFVSDDGEQNAEFKRLLESQLKAEKPPFEIRRAAEIVLSGQLSKGSGKANNGDSFDSVALRVEGMLKLREPRRDLQGFNINVFGDEALQLLGPTAEFPKDLPEAEKQQKLDKQLGTNAEAFVNGSRTFSDKNGKFSLEILAREGSGKAASPRTPIAVEGRAFVKLTQGEEYVIRIYNEATDEAAVALTIDGLSMFTFAEDGTQDSFLLVGSNKFVDIPGWYITGKKTDVFEVSSYAKSAAESKNLPASGIGVITARFHVSQTGEGKGDEATKRGRQIDQEYKQERRVIGSSRAFVTVRYNRDGQ